MIAIVDQSTESLGNFVSMNKYLAAWFLKKANF